MIVGISHYQGQFGLNSSRRHGIPTWRVLLDSGSTGDLLFEYAGSKNPVPYFVRAIPEVWHTSSGIFRTDRRAEVELKFPEFSNNKRVKLRRDVVKYKSEADAPLFDLIIGTETLFDLGIDLNFKTKLITIDEIKLPMRNIKYIQNPNVRYNIYKNSF